MAATTNYDLQKNVFDCSAVESVIELALKSSGLVIIVIKSTIPGLLGSGSISGRGFTWMDAGTLYSLRKATNSVCMIEQNNNHYLFIVYLM